MRTHNYSKNQNSSIFEFYKSRLDLVLFASLITIVIYLPQAYSLSIQIDTETLINGAHSLNWLEIGRFGLHFVQKLLTLWNYNPYFSGCLMLIFFCLSALLWIYLYNYLSCGQKRFNYYLFILIYLTNPIWASQFYFSLQQAAICLVMCLLSVGIYLQFSIYKTDNRIEKIFKLLLIICVLTLVFASYQAFVSVYAVAVSFGLLLGYQSNYLGEKTKSFLSRGLMIIGTGIICFVLYLFLLKFFPQTNYLESMVYWKNGFINTVHNLWEIAKLVFSGIKFYYGIFVALGLIIALLKIVSNKISWQRKAIEISLIIMLVVSSMLMFLYIGNTPVFRAQIAVPLFTACFLSYVFYSETYKRYKIERLMICIISWTLIIPVFVNTKVTTSLFYVDEMRDVQDRALAQQINFEIQKISTDPSIKNLYIIGKKDLSLNASTQEAINLGVEMFPASGFNWDYSPMNISGVSGRATAYINAVCGTNYYGLDNTFKEEAEALSRTMPNFPKEGSVIQGNGFYVVKLSD